ncbi:MAG TPA: hypothetical protein PLE69_04465, partial [bacterium]|nr:hypothetical protein [bacterium]
RKTGTPKMNLHKNLDITYINQKNGKEGLKMKFVGKNKLFNMYTWNKILNYKNLLYDYNRIVLTFSI